MLLFSHQVVKHSLSTSVLKLLKQLLLKLVLNVVTGHISLMLYILIVSFALPLLVLTTVVFFLLLGACRGIVGIERWSASSSGWLDCYRLSNLSIAFHQSPVSMLILV